MKRILKVEWSSNTWGSEACKMNIHKWLFINQEYATTSKKIPVGNEWKQKRLSQVSRAARIPMISEMPGESIEVGPKLRKLGLPRQNDGRRTNENGRRETPDHVLVAICRIVLEVMHSVLDVHPLPILSSVPFILPIKQNKLSRYITTTCYLTWVRGLRFWNKKKYRQDDQHQKRRIFLHRAGIVFNLRFKWSYDYEFEVYELMNYLTPMVNGLLLPPTVSVHFFNSLDSVLLWLFHDMAKRHSAQSPSAIGILMFLSTTKRR